MAAFFLHTFEPQPILAKLGPFTIHWYGLLLSLGVLAGYLVFHRLGRAYGIKVSDLEGLFFWSVIGGIIGARLYHVINEWAYYVARPREILSIWNGGLAIHGALLVGLVVFILYSRWKKIPFWLLADIAVPGVALGQAIGRWGNYFNQELFGTPTSLPWGIPIEPLNRPIEYLGSQYFHPTFLYESLGSLLVFAILIVLHRMRLRHQKKNDGWKKISDLGMVALSYFILESLVRFATEWLRIDRVPLIFGVRLPLLTSIAIALAASIIMFVRLRKPRTT